VVSFFEAQCRSPLSLSY